MRRREQIFESESSDALNTHIEEGITEWKQRRDKERKARKRELKYGPTISETTKEYFKDWDELHFERQFVLDSIEENILWLEDYNSDQFRQLADIVGVSVEQYKHEMQKQVERIVGESDFFIALSFETLQKVLVGDYRFRASYEAYKKTMPDHRDPLAEVEADLFGYDEMSIVDRPIYGYFSNNPHGVVNLYGKTKITSNTSPYGGVFVKINKERALECATITFTDSFHVSGNDKARPSLAKKPHFISIGIEEEFGTVTSSSDWLDTLKETSSSKRKRYTEAQFHGRITLEDVDELQVARHNGLKQEEIDAIKKLIQEYNTAGKHTINVVDFSYTS